jgi:hypothetical protein
MIDDLLVGFEDALITQSVAWRYAYAKKADVSAVFGLLDKELTKFPKRNGWWDPPKNLAINSALMGINLWRFSLLPFHPLKRAYRAAEGRFPEGIVIHPNWHPLNDKTYPDDTLEIVQKMIELVKGFSVSLPEMVAQELRWIETKFGVKVPDAIETKLKIEIVKIATRRWSTNRLKTKDTLIPFDGSKAIELGAFD